MSPARLQPESWVTVLPSGCAEALERGVQDGLETGKEVG